VDALVTLDGVGVSLGGRPVLRGIDLVVAPGAVIGLTGPNGSGKTTLVRLIATLARPDTGRGGVLGAALGTDAVYQVRHRIGLIGHAPALIPELTFAENLTHIARLGGIDPARVGRSLSVVGLEGAADRRVSAGSHGMLRRAEIAVMLMRSPELLLLDEAATGLDSESADLVASLVTRTTSEGGGVLIASHDPTRLASCHRVLSLERGRIGAVG
jgi:heme exporter protein A